MKYIIKVLILSILLNVSILFMIPYPTMGGDWFIHAVSLPTQFSNGDFSVPKERTALFSIIIFLINKTPYQYWISQIISVILNSIYLIPSYFIAKQLFSEKVAKISTLFMVFVPVLIFNTIYTWPKNAAMAFILAMIYFIFFSNDKYKYIIGGIAGGIAFLFHTYALFYIIISFFLLIKYKHNLKNITLFMVSAMFFITMNYLWIYLSYGSLQDNVMIYYPFAIKGYYQALIKDPEIYTVFFSTPIHEIFFVRLITILMTLTPLPIFATSYETYNPLYYYVKSYSGGLSTLMYFVIVLTFIKKRTINKIVSTFLLYPFLIGLVLWGWKDWGIVSQYLHPTVPFLIMIGINEVYKNKKILVLLSIGLIIDIYFLYTFMNISFIGEGGLQTVTETAKALNNTLTYTDIKSLYYLLH